MAPNIQIKWCSIMMRNTSAANIHLCNVNSPIFLLIFWIFQLISTWVKWKCEDFYSKLRFYTFSWYNDSGSSAVEIRWQVLGRFSDGICRDIVTSFSGDWNHCLYNEKFMRLITPWFGSRWQYSFTQHGIKLFTHFW